MLILLFFFALMAIRSIKGIIVIAVFLAILFANYFYFPESRAGIIVKILMQNDIYYLLSIDGSVNERLSAIIGPYYGLAESYLVPNSAFRYNETYLSLRSYTNGFFWWGGGDKIMNYLGSIIYELSLLGIFLIYRYVFNGFRSWFGFSYLLVVLFYLSNSMPLLHGYPLLLFSILFDLNSKTKFDTR